ncbi:hypothetical protein CTAYLR_002959 [Chrysophaeum taylorii]|uniref:subtilisin n=1 Tax=Chrysophaeum taylorii TaxID=2483200 RepID=A0AAD7U4X0_9STRA|nr:hypothetical protein CTAYLR_002959 [Chrysophaeum taylorii]
MRSRVLGIAVLAQAWPIHIKHEEVKLGLKAGPFAARTAEYHAELEATPEKRGVWLVGFESVTAAREQEECVRRVLGEPARGRLKLGKEERKVYTAYVAGVVAARRASDCVGVETVTPLAPELRYFKHDFSAREAGTRTKVKKPEKTKPPKAVENLVVDFEPGSGATVATAVEEWFAREFADDKKTPWVSKAIDVGRRALVVRNCPQNKLDDLAAALLALDRVVAVATEEQPRLDNYNARWIVQTNNRHSEESTPLYTDMGLSGDGVIININDDGLDVFSCWFRDDDLPITEGSLDSTTDLTLDFDSYYYYYDHSFIFPDASSELYFYNSTEHRKIRYALWPFYDPSTNFFDEVSYNPGMHGSHVAGSALGSSHDFHISTRNVTDYTGDGIAPGAKIAFLDMSGSYNSYSVQIDDFCFKNQDTLVLFSAGNSGQYLFTIGSPGVAKNVLTVGASTSYEIDGLDEALEAASSPTLSPVITPFPSYEPTAFETDGSLTSERSLSGNLEAGDSLRFDIVIDKAITGTISTCGSNYDTTLALWVRDDEGRHSQLRYNDDYCCCDTNVYASQITATLSAENHYYVVLFRVQFKTVVRLTSFLVFTVLVGRFQSDGTISLGESVTGTLDFGDTKYFEVLRDSSKATNVVVGTCGSVFDTVLRLIYMVAGGTLQFEVNLAETTGPRYQTIVITTCGSMFDAVLSLSVVSDEGSLETVATNDDCFCCSSDTNDDAFLQSAILTTIESSKTYLATVQGYSTSDAGVAQVSMRLPTETGKVVSTPDVVYFSSRGPTFDGRIKPDVVAPGDAIYSAKAAPSAATETCTLTPASGTSMSTPVVAGIVALLQQYFSDGYYPTGVAGANAPMIPMGTAQRRDRARPSSCFVKKKSGPLDVLVAGAALKALVIAAGQYMNGIDANRITSTYSNFPTFPNYDQGFGLVKTRVAFV